MTRRCLSFRGVPALLLILALPAIGRAQAVASDPGKMQELEKQLRQLQESQANLKRMLDELRLKPVAPGAVLGELGPVVNSTLPITLHGTITMRYDWTRFEDQVDRLQDNLRDQINGLRTRVRFLVEVGREDDFISGGFRLTTGQSVNPTAPFITLGDGFRTRSFGLDEFYGVIRPIRGHRDRLLLIFGSAPNQFFRGDRGSFRSELIWDDDVSPEGLQILATFFKRKDFKIENLAAVFILQDVFHFRFEGLTGAVTLVADQFRLRWKWMSGAVAYYDYENLNSGLRTPTFRPDGSGIFLTQGRNADLLRAGLQFTNNHRTYGPNAEGFVNDRMRLFNAIWQGHLPIPNVKTTAEIHLLVDYSYNFIRSRSNYSNGGQHGYGITLGITAGDWKGSWLHPFNLYITYRDVDADAVLGTFADSDLGGGSQYRGVEVSWNYRITRHLLLNFSAFRFNGYPNKDVSQSRIYGDVVFDF